MKIKGQKNRYPYEHQHNSQNQTVSRDFEIGVKKWFENKYHMEFERNSSFSIGNPPKAHRFDVVSEDKLIVAECKCYTWTETGNIPSAKMGSVNEAVFYLSFINDADTYVVLKKSMHPKRSETLAEYYYGANKHLLGHTEVLEFDADMGIMRKMGTVPDVF
ncbi:MAG: hypothetical protein FWF05_03635 [Oscillospiraceae bacterium]|nr:hypothetical protein [Oscillospiraceae bacterium]